MAGVILPDRKPETIKEYNDSLFAPTEPYKERQDQDQPEESR